MTRCTCLWRQDRESRLLPDPECPSSRHADDLPVPQQAGPPATERPATQEA